jgi:hypothetical protein
MFMETGEIQLQLHSSYRPGLISSLPDHTLSHLSFQELLKNSEILFDDSLAHAKRCISLIEDPLWKHICNEVMHIMGPLSVLKIWNSKLGALSSQDKIIDLYCQTEESAQFVQQYAFIILGSLKYYFPVLKKLRIRSELLI